MKTILIIEDNEGNRENISELLVLEGYDVISASNGLSGLEQAIAFLPDLILCDIRMPGMNGYEFFDEIKRNSPTQFTPIIFVTSSVESKEILYAREKGINGYLEKPFSCDDLFRIIRCCLAAPAAGMVKY